MTRALSHREAQALALVIDGLSNKEIGRIMNCSEGTVKTHLRHVLDKTGFRNRTELAVQMTKRGWSYADTHD
jgi:DNA-binding CsgD family transcriptional regulator